MQETKENAYAHHVQRLMVLGNFALLAGIDPKQVNEWCLIVYADAYEWIGMMYKTHDRMDDEKKRTIHQDSQDFLDGLT